MQTLSDVQFIHYSGLFPFYNINIHYKTYYLLVFDIKISLINRMYINKNEVFVNY